MTESYSFQLELHADFKSTYEVLERLEHSVSPLGLGFFLSVGVLQHITDRAESRFRAEGDDAVGKWAPLTPGTENIRQNLGYGAAHPINRRTGDLEDLITQANANSTVSVNPIGAVLEHPALPSGKLEDKLRTAQMGDSSQPGYQPTVPRPVIALNEADLVWVLSALAYYIESGLAP
jgi:hypothetical protein